MSLFHGKVKCKAIAGKQIVFRFAFPKVYELAGEENNSVATEAVISNYDHKKAA